MDAVKPPYPHEAQGDNTRSRGACFRDAEAAMKAQTSARRSDQDRQNSGGGRRKTSRWETICSACSPVGPGATIPGTGRRPGQTVGRARGLSVSTAFDPTLTSDIISYQSSIPFSSYRVPHQRHK